jgi:hypothetical protein
VLLRAIVPLWICAGATFKLLEGNPGLLPKGILIDAHKLGINLDALLATLISIEYVAAIAIVFLPRLARPTAIFMLAVFCLVLLREIAAGNTSCGCLGAKSPSPFVMLIIDGAMLAGILLLKPRRWTTAPARRWPVAAAIVLAGAAAGTSFGWLLPMQPTAPLPPPPDPVTPGLTSGGATGGERVPEPLPLPTYWFESDYQTWVGRDWTEVDLFRFMDVPPVGLTGGKWYVVFYGRTCDHCEVMFRDILAPNPDLARRVIAIEVPTEDDGAVAAGSWEVPATACRMMRLPAGVNWIITTPLALRIEYGLIVCSEEGDVTACFELE